MWDLKQKPKFRPFIRPLTGIMTKTLSLTKFSINSNIGQKFLNDEPEKDCFPVKQICVLSNQIGKKLVQLTRN